MRLKRICSMAAAVVVTVAAAVFPAFAGCNKGDKTKVITVKVPATSTLNVPASTDLDKDVKKVSTLLERASSAFTAQYDKKVKFNIVEFAGGEETKAITNAFDTDSAADVLYDWFYNMSLFIHTGRVVPLDGTLSETTVSDLSARYVGGGTYNGKQYMLPYMVSQNILIYNKEMLRECGLEKYAVAEAKGEKTIAHWSIDEWTEILDVMAQKYLADGSGKVPMMMYAKDNQGDTHIMTMLRAFGSEVFGADNNFILADDPKALEAFGWLYGGVEKGWYLPVADDKTLNDNSSKFKMGELGFFNFNLGSVTYTEARDDETDKYGFVNYPGDNCTFFCEGFEVFDNGDAEKIEIAKDFITYFYENEKWLEYSACSMPVSGRVMEKYKGDIFLLDEFSKNAVNAVDFTHNLPNWQGSENSVRNIFYKEIAKLLRSEYTPEECAKNLQEKLNAAIASGRENSKYHE